MRAALLLLCSAAVAVAQVAPRAIASGGPPVVTLELVRAYDSRLPSPTSTDVREILGEANRVLRAKLPVSFGIKIVNAGEMPLPELFRTVDLAAADRDGPVWRYDFARGARAPAFTEPQAQAVRLKYIQAFTLQELGNIMPAVQPKTYPAYRAALEAEYHRKMAWLASLELPGGGPVLQMPLPPWQSAMDWRDFLAAQDRFDIVLTNTLIAWDVTHSPPPHSIFHHAKLGGGAMASPRRRALGQQAVLLDVFEEYGGVAGICRTDPAVGRSERNRIIGAVLLAHELGHALFSLPDVYDHGDACLMNSSAHNLDQREAYRLLIADLHPCTKCAPWVHAAVELAAARRAAAAGDVARAAALFESGIADTPGRLSRDRPAYMFGLATEALPVLEKAGRTDAAARCRDLIRTTGN